MSHKNIGQWGIRPWKTQILILCLSKKCFHSDEHNYKVNVRPLAVIQFLMLICLQMLQIKFDLQQENLNRKIDFFIALSMLTNFLFCLLQPYIFLDMFLKVSRFSFTWISRKKYNEVVVFGSTTLQSKTVRGRYSSVYSKQK